MAHENGNGAPLLDADEHEDTKPDAAKLAESDAPPPAWLRPLVEEFRKREAVLLSAHESAAAIHGALNEVRSTLGGVDVRLTKLEKRVALLLVLTEVLRSLVPDNVWSMLGQFVGS